jgi:uncharacterized membrane protein HdeD (DUF308 family)
MSVESPPSFPDPGPARLGELRRYWVWLLVLGLSLILLGVIALGCLPLVTEASVMLYGLVLIASGIVHVIQAVRFPRWAGFLVAVLIGVLDVVVGLFMLTNTLEAAVIMTLLLAVFFFVGGLFRIIASVALRSPNWGWSLLAGVVSLLLGVAIWRRWPLSSFYAIGLFVGIEMLLRGWALIMLALAVRRLPAKLDQAGA